MSKRHTTTLLYLCVATCLAVLLTACDSQTVYDHYEQTPVSGWEKNDTLVFETEPIAQGGRYKVEVGLRIKGNYPFLGLNLLVDQTILPSHEKHSSTLSCQLIDKQGYAKGRGVSHFQYLFHLTTLDLKRGERLHVAIRHGMKREILPGITDIGLRLQKVPKQH